jgi:hypothetical protein
MSYVVAGYIVVLGILFLYALTLVWRRRRLTRAALRVESLPPAHGRAAGIAAPADDQ